MSIKQNVERAKRDYDETYTAGMEKGFESIETISDELEQTLYGTDTGGKSFYDEFWDEFQSYGKLDSYYSKFSNSQSTTWTNITYNPKYELNCTRDNNAASNVFQYNRNLLSTKVPINCQGVHMQRTFEYSYIRQIPLLRIDENTTFSNTFRDCTKLKDVIMEGTIGQNGFDTHWSTALSKASIKNIIECLSTTATGLTVTLSKTAVDKAFETSTNAVNGSTSNEWVALIATRNNWTISLA